MSDVTREVLLKIQVEQAETSKQLGKVNDQLKQMETELEKVRAKTKNTSSEMAAGLKGIEEQAAALPGPIGNVASALGSVRGATDAFGKSLFTLRGAIMATGIGALAVILASLYEAFTGTERGAQRFRVLMAGLGGLMEGINTVLEKIGNALIDLFTKPSETLKSFGESIRTYVVENFQKILNGAGILGQAMTKLFAGDFAGALDTATEGVKELGDGFLSLNPATAIVWNLAKGVKSVTEESIAAAEAFAALEVRMNAVKGAERDLTIERAKSNKTIAEARLIADDATKSIDDRIAAVRRAGQIEQQVANQELVIARERLAILEGQRLAGEEKEEQLDAIAAANARVFELERENIMRMRRLQSEEISLLKEAEAKKKAIDDAEAARLKALREAAEARFKAESERLKSYLTQLSDARVASIEDERKREEESAKLAFERKLANIVGEGEVETQLRLALADEYNLKLAQLNKKYRDQADAKRKADDAKELADAEKLRNAKLNLAQSTGQGIMQIGRLVSAAMADNAEVAKGIAVAEVWINAATATASAISKAVQSSMTPYDMIANIAVAVGTVAGAIASTIDILNKADIPGGSGGTVGQMPSFTATAPSGAPVATNVTGLVNTQTAELQPIQAFVVETQMTGTQSNVAQIYSQATFGLGG